MKANIIPTLINKEKHKELLGNVPCGQLLDLAVVYRIVEADEEGFSAALVTNEVQETINMSAGELEAVAKENFKTKYAPELYGLTETFKVMTNSVRLFGASGLLYGELLREAAESFGKDYFILPASAHEVMLVPEGAMETEELKAILQEGNEKLASEEEFLSENIYRYSAGSGELEIVSI